ncbi:hypothetical protein SM0020_01580 [Sinorhizobium meliloti CCNWSX0020]|uniref:Transmembrane protein n=2 Tax=Sinorhizobium TaxID=28105 RepID=H0FT51_RHIML|nr:MULTISPECIES: hypothetical protein [Sinorhizobium]EHK79739.1 hypothetical protein SM0020_01580 [Sinorhizobium meliloti CCNWSX0020]WHS95084.1 hypothetical protein PZL22_002840 [Sinorhizobium kummerowiae]WRW47039.1 hypothetical protein VPK21_005257 [Sinorhizobium kummerowiae]
MNATKAMTQSRYTVYGARPARRPTARHFTHAIAVAAAFTFICALLIGAF